MTEKIRKMEDKTLGAKKWRREEMAENKASDVPFSDPAPTANAGPPAVAVSSAKSLTIKLDDSLYSALCHYRHQKEIERGSRVTHQDVIVEGLRKLLGLDA